MAARRIFSLLATRIPQNTLPKAVFPNNSHLSPNSTYRYYENYVRRFQTIAEQSIPHVEKNPLERESCSLSPVASTNESKIDQTTIKHQVNSNLKISERHDLVMMFTCKVCDTRMMKTVCRESYDKGVVVARCDGCNNLHLIADRLGWFGEPGSVEEFLATRGEQVKKGSVDTLNLTLEDLAGKKI